MIIHGSEEPSRTELATRKLADRLGLSNAEIRRTLEDGREEDFANSKLYERVFDLADQARGKPVPRAIVPNIRLRSAKITRDLTTEWFAKRVKTRYTQCLARTGT